MTYVGHGATVTHMDETVPGKIPPLTLGWRLRMSMESAALKAEDMAEILGVHRATISRWCHDIGAPPRKVYLERWAQLTGVPYKWLAEAPTPADIAWVAGVLPMPDRRQQQVPVQEDRRHCARPHVHLPEQHDLGMTG